MIRNLVDEKFSAWKVLSFHERRKSEPYWLCECQCGTVRSVQHGSLVRGGTKSCGCLKGKLIADSKRTHGMGNHPIYNSWKAMHSRCNNVSDNNYKNYGARGIKVCKRWNTFENFYSDMGEAWKDGLTIERKNINGDYKPSNCTWIPKKDQSRNKRNNRFIDTPKGRMIASDACRVYGIKPAAMCIRMQRWPKERWLDAKNTRVNITEN